MDRRPIGVFDSGIGGLTVVKELKKILPGEKIIYFGDTARVPYGTKSKDTVTRFSKESVRFLLRFKVKLVVIACNTASSLSLPALRKSFRVPIIGVIRPGVRRIFEITETGPVGIIGTRATISSAAYERLLKKKNPSLKAISKACPLFVPLVEEGLLHSDITEVVIKKYLWGFKKSGIKALILGCTHYPLLKKAIKKYMGKEMCLVDSAQETARMVRDILIKKRLLSEKKRESSHKYFVTDEPSTFKKVGSMFLEGNIGSVIKVRI